MDGQAWDNLARRLGRAASRRKAVRTVAAILVGGLGASFGQGGLATETCRVKGERCKRNRDCCSPGCVRRGCACQRRRQQCTDPAQCCPGQGSGCDSTRESADLVCCAVEGEACAAESDCCGTLRCVDGVCGGTNAGQYVEHGECDTGRTCVFDDCRDGACIETPAACRVRTFVLVPSDKTDLPDDGTIRQQMGDALATIATYYRDKTGLQLRFATPEVLHAEHDLAWFSQAAAGHGGGRDEPPPLVEEDWSGPTGKRRAESAVAAALPGTDYGQLWRYMNGAGYGMCSDGWITLVVVASTLGGGAVGGTRCGASLRRTADAGPDDGPGRSGLAFVGQWVVDVVLTGEDSASCRAEVGADHWACPANVGWGTIAHELGHALGLPHPCDSWYRDGWRFSAATCDNLVMQAHWNYPRAGFDGKEIAVLASGKAMDR